MAVNGKKPPKQTNKKKKKKKKKKQLCILYKVVLKIYTQINSDQRNSFKLMKMCLDLHYQINNENENKLLKPTNESLHLDVWSKCAVFFLLKKKKDCLHLKSRYFVGQ
jgi:hypothetical protein